MVNFKNIATFSLILMGIAGCKSSSIDKLQTSSNAQLITKEATKETKALYSYLMTLPQNRILFGHQDANAYGHSWRNEPGRSDVKDVCGSNPAVYGCDFGHLTAANSPVEQKSVEAELRQRIKEVYERGAINTVTWHFNNPIGEKSFYWEKDPIAAVPRIIPGGDYHGYYKQKLDKMANFINTLKGENGESIPLIFRPFHEYDGEWFWWGVPYHCTKEEFISLWRFTITYLRDVKKLNNLIFAISPDCRFHTTEQLLEFYPGDEYVDMIGMDNYWDLRPDGGSLADFAKKIKIVSDVARSRNKLCALTETGLEGIPQADWWTNVLMPLINKDDLKLSYVMVWRNAYDNPTHYYAPFLGQVSADDFVKFYKSDFTIFESDLKNIYK